jgi:hypothetical protein
LHKDKCFANRQCPSVTAGNRLTAEIGDNAPRSENGHEKHHRDGKAIVHEEKELQRFRAFSLGLEPTLFESDHAPFNPEIA